MSASEVHSHRGRCQDLLKNLRQESLPQPPQDVRPVSLVVVCMVKVQAIAVELGNGRSGYYDSRWLGEFNDVHS